MTTTEIATTDAPPCTRAEAEELLDRYNTARDNLGLAFGHWHGLYVEMHDREAWRAFGYAGWGEFAEQELGVERTKAYRLLHQAELVASLESAGIEVSSVSQRTAALLAGDDVAVGEIVDEVEQGVKPAQAVRNAANRRRPAARPERTPEPPAEPEPAPAVSESMRAAREALGRRTPLVGLPRPAPEVVAGDGAEREQPGSPEQPGAWEDGPVECDTSPATIPTPRAVWKHLLDQLLDADPAEMAEVATADEIAFFQGWTDRFKIARVFVTNGKPVPKAAPKPASKATSDCPHPRPSCSPSKGGKAFCRLCGKEVEWSAVEQ